MNRKIFLYALFSLMGTHIGLEASKQEASKEKKVVFDDRKESVDEDISLIITGAYVLMPFVFVGMMALVDQAHRYLVRQNILVNKGNIFEQVLFYAMIAGSYVYMLYLYGRNALLWRELDEYNREKVHKESRTYDVFYAVISKGLVWLVVPAVILFKINRIRRFFFFIYPFQDNIYAIVVCVMIFAVFHLSLCQENEELEATIEFERKKKALASERSKKVSS